MSMTDPISDLLTRIRNAHMAKYATLTIPSSRMKLEIVRIMRDEGYLEGFSKLEDDKQGKIQIELKYQGDQPAISGMERVSKPSRRIYRGKNSIPKVLNGLGVTIVSTPKGVMTGTACSRQGIGGEVLCSIW